MQDAKVEARIRRKFRLVAVELDERRRRQWAAAEARDVGWGGISLVARATGLSRPTIMAGLKDLERSAKSRLVAAARVRSPGGGRRTLTQSDPGLLEALERLIDPATRGDPMSPLRWTCKSTAKLAEELTRQNHPVSDRTVAMLLKQSGYSLQANRKIARRLVAPGPQCSVRVHQPAGDGVSEAATTRGLGGHEKEGIGRRIQESGRGMAAPGPAANR